jgi:hypothetical protein
MATKIQRYTISVDDTWKGDHFKWMSDDLDDAIRKASRLVETMKCGNAIVRFTNDEDKMLYYVEK